MNIFELLSEKFVLPERPKLFEAFAGVGCQTMGFKRVGKAVEHIGISEIDKDAILSYAAIHTDWLDVRDSYEFPDKQIMVNELQSKMVGFDFKRMQHTITMKTNIENVKDYYLAHKRSGNTGDISKVTHNDLPQIDMLTYSFPCTDLSKAGKQKGLNNTRSGLVYEVLRILHELDEVKRLPKVLVMENVVDLIQSKFIKQFHEIQLELEQLGYSNYTETMNAKHYEVAQNRDRVFMVSILGEYYYEFPKPVPLTKRLKDYLESNVDKKYYLSQSFINAMNSDSGLFNRAERFEQSTHKETDSAIAFTVTTRAGSRPTDNFVKEPLISYALGSREFEARGWLGECPTLCARDYKDPKVVLEPIIQQKSRGFNDGGLHETCPPITSNCWHENNKLVEPVCLNPKVNGKQPSLQDRVYDSDGISTAITTGFMPSVTEPSVIVIGNYTPGEHNASRVDDDCGLAPTVKENHGTITAIAEPVICASRGRNPESPKSRESGLETVQMIEPKLDGTSNTLTTVQKDNMVLEPTLQIRKLTPRECWRLMGIDDEDFDKASKVCSNSQLYKQAGNGIVVDVFAAIIKNMM